MRSSGRILHNYSSDAVYFLLVVMYIQQPLMLGAGQALHIPGCNRTYLYTSTCSGLKLGACLGVFTSIKNLANFIGEHMQLHGSKLSCILFHGAGQSRGSLRLVLGDGEPRPGLSAGFVQAFYEGEWGRVCDSTRIFGQEEATVTCRQLGFIAALDYGTIGSGVAFLE